MTINFHGAFLFSLVLVGVKLLGDGIVGNNLRTGAIGAAFILVGLLLAFRPIL